MIDNKTYYQILQISNEASPDEIKKAYRKLSFAYHPDKNPNKIEEFKKINEAYEILSDKYKRSQYDFDIQMSSNIHHSNPMDSFMENIFESMLNKQSKNKKNKSKQPFDDLLNLFNSSSPYFQSADNFGPFDIYTASIPFPPHMNQSKHIDTPTLEDIHVDQEIDFDDSYHGCCVPILVEREIISNADVKRKETEKIYLTIQKGVDHDEIITIENKGNVYQDKTSNIKVHIKVKDHIHFKRSGIHLVLPKTISFKESLCGFDFMLEHLNGKSNKLSSSRGNIIQNGDKKVIKGMGFERNDKKGDLIILFHVNHPEHKLNEEQLKLIEEIF